MNQWNNTVNTLLAFIVLAGEEGIDFILYQTYEHLTALAGQPNIYRSVN